MSSASASTAVNARAKLGRAAGFGYLVMAVCQGFWFGSMQTFRGHGEAALLDHLRDGRTLFELSIIAGVLGFVAYLSTAGLLYRRFVAEAGIAATLLFTYVVASVPVSLIAVGAQFELLALLNAGGPDPGSLVPIILRSFDILMQISSLFWGLWLFPLAWLAWRSRGSGRFAGAFLAFGGLGYAFIFVRAVLWPGAATGPVDIAATVATVLSEFGVILWLLLAADRPIKPTG